MRACNLILTGWSKSAYLAAAAAALEVEGSVPKVVVPKVKGSVPKYVLATEDHELVGADRRAARSELPDDLDAAIRQHIKSVFDKTNHNLTAAKNALGISINTLKKYLA